MSPVENTDWIRAGFIRQRRNLFVISLVLAFKELSGITIQKINVMGTELVIQNPLIVTYALRAAFVYWTWRYSSFFLALGGTGFQQAKWARLQYWVGRWLTTNFMGDTSRLGQLIDTVRRECGKAGGKAPSEERAVSGYTFNRSESNLHEVRHCKELAIRITFNYRMAVHGGSTIEAREQCIYPLKGPRALLYNIEAAWYALFRTQVFSEYYAPIVVAIGAGLAWGYRMFVG